MDLTGKNVTKDRKGRVTHLEHLDEPYVATAFAAATSPEQLADDYLQTVFGQFNLDASMLADLSSAAPAKATPSEGARLHRAHVKDIAGSVVVDYKQTYAGLPVWSADFAVHIAPNPMRVTSSTSSVHEQITLGNDVKKVAAGYKRLVTAELLRKALGFKSKSAIAKINGLNPVVYEYDPALRTPPDTGDERTSFEQTPPIPPLPAVPASIKPGVHYAAVEVLFDLALPNWPDLHWRAIVEPIAASVLYLRPLVAHATGSIFRMDPISLSGDATLIPSAPEASLAAWRSTVPITELVAATPQALSGTRVDLAEIENPVQADPTTPAPNAFVYPVKTTDFTATNAYYHVNWFFNLIQGMGFNLNTYFDGTTFPVPIDHWGLGGSAVVNAHCPGNVAGNGIGHMCFAAAQAGQNVGIADDVRVVIHEFGHGLLWDHVDSPNFGFAHSAGDALAAILMDPASLQPDRFLTFPWPQLGGAPLDRRHDRAVAAGWGWFGTQWNTQYGGEQVLSTTLFRIYRSLGGDSPYAADRRWAARYTSYLILKAIGTLTATTPNPEVFATALMNADLTTVDFEGHPGGAVHKVIRWAFEKQGLYGPNAFPGTPIPVTTEGNPPAVDVYIDDGRHGEYQYTPAFWENQDMWVRRRADGGTTHQNPAIGRTNYMYVRVKNRGTQPATNVRVKAYHCNPGTGLAWPTHWSPMDTPELPAAAAIPPGGSTIVGPFAWKPTVFSHECLLAIASAKGDAGNDTTVAGPVSHSRFVPFDNNIGQRNVNPVFVLDWTKILKLFQKVPFEVSNPFKRAVKVELVGLLPKVLTDRKLWVFFNSEGGNKFELAANQTRKCLFSLSDQQKITRRSPFPPTVEPAKPGIRSLEDLLEPVGDAADTPNRGASIRVLALIDGELAGGITYVLEGMNGGAPGGGPIGLTSEALDEEPGEGGVQGVIRAIGDQPGVRSVRVRRLNLDIELEDE
jgi:hypothetical protein